MTQPVAATRARTRSILFACAAGALLLAPAGASAAATPVEAYGIYGIGTVQAIANITEPAPRVIAVSYSGGAILVSDSGGVVAVGPNCAQVSPTIVSCTNPPGFVIRDVTVFAPAGDDQITATSLGPNVTQTYIDGNGGNDTMTTGPTADQLRADEGDDMLDGGLGPDQLEGMAGIDTATYANRTEPITIKINSAETLDGIVGDPDGADGGAEGDNVDTENVIGGSGDDTIEGQKSAQGSGAKLTKSLPEGIYTGGPGNDTLAGGYDSDQLLGGPGNDRLLGEQGSDKLDGESGKDRLSGGTQKDRLKGGAGKDRCSGGKGNDRARQCENESSVP